MKNYKYLIIPPPSPSKKKGGGTNKIAVLLKFSNKSKINRTINLFFLIILYYVIFSGWKGGQWPRDRSKSPCFFPDTLDHNSLKDEFSTGKI